MISTLISNLLISTISVTSSINIIIVSNNLMITFFSANRRTVMKIRVQDLYSDDNLISENVSYFLLTQIARENLNFK